MRGITYLSDDGLVRIMVHGFYVYEVPVEECRTMPDICRWFFHLQGKPWMTEAMLRRFAKLMCEANGFGAADSMPWRG